MQDETSFAGSNSERPPTFKFWGIISNVNTCIYLFSMKKNWAYRVLWPHNIITTLWILSTVFQVIHVVRCLTAPNHCLKQCWLIVNYTFKKMFKWNFHRNYQNFIHENYLIISWYLHVWNGVAVAAYSRLASRSQAKFQTMKLSPLSAPRAAAPAQSTVSACRSLDFGHCYSVPYMKIPANNQVIFIKNVVTVAAYRSCRLWRRMKMSWIHYLLCDHHWIQCRHAISDTGHVA